MFWRRIRLCKREKRSAKGAQKQPVQAPKSPFPILSKPTFSIVKHKQNPQDTAPIKASNLTPEGVNRSCLRSTETYLKTASRRRHTP